MYDSKFAIGSVSMVGWVGQKEVVDTRSLQRNQQHRYSILATVPFSGPGCLAGVGMGSFSLARAFGLSRSHDGTTMTEL